MRPQDDRRTRFWECRTGFAISLIPEEFTMSIALNRFSARHVVAAVAIACLPLTAFAWGSQAGDNGRYPIGADNEGPRQAIPNQTTNDAPVYYQSQSSTTYYYVSPSEGYMAQPAYVESHPAYMTYYYTAPRAPSYYVYSSPQTYVYTTPEYSTYDADMSGDANPCVPLYAAPTECLHGGIPGG